MPQTRANKIQVPVNSDAWNLAADLATMADTTNAPIKVSSAAERDALTKTVGLRVVRTDLGGSTETWDGSTWRGLFMHAEFTGNSGPGTPSSANQLWGIGVLTKDSANSMNDASITSPGNDAITLPGPAVWDVFGRVVTSVRAPTIGNTWLSARNSPTGTEYDSCDLSGTTGRVRFMINVTGASQTVYFRFQSDSTGYVLTSRVIVERRW